MKLILSVVLLAVPSLLMAGPMAELAIMNGVDPHIALDMEEAFETIKAIPAADEFVSCVEFIRAEKARSEPSLDQAGKIINDCFSHRSDRHIFTVEVVRKDFTGSSQIRVPGFSLKIRVLVNRSSSLHVTIPKDFNFSVKEKRSGRLLGFPADVIIEDPVSDLARLALALQTLDQTRR